MTSSPAWLAVADGTPASHVRQPRWSVAIGLVAALTLASLALLASAPALALYLAAFVLFTSPGWPLARRVLGDGVPLAARAPFALLFGYAAGSALGLVLRLAGLAFPVPLLGTCVALAAALAWLGGGRADGVLGLPRLATADPVALATIATMVLAIVVPVFVNVGRGTPQGLAYRAYFIADLFAHMSVVGELSGHGGVTVNPYFPAESLPYYWTYFSLPALFAALRPTLEVDRGLLLTALLMAVVYASVWYLVLRALGASPLASAVAIMVVVLAASFEGTYFLVHQWMRGRPLDAFRYVNIDAITRWIWDLPPVDGLHRLFWYTPQHGFAITLGLLAVVAPALARRGADLWRGVLEGALLGLALASSSFNGLLLVAAYAIAEVAWLFRAPRTAWSAWVIGRVVAASIVGVFAALTVALRMIQGNANQLMYAWNPHFSRGPMAFLALSFGVALLIAPFGVRAAWRANARAALGLAALALVSVVAFLFVDVRGHENTYVSFRVAQFLLLVMAVCIAHAVDAIRPMGLAARAVLWTAVVVGGLLALPTVVLDAYNARDITNVAVSPGGFPWTVHISWDELAAAHWLRDHTTETSIVQTDASARGRASWALVPAFAHRALYVGLGLFEPNPRRFETDIGRIRIVFRTPDLEIARGYCERLGIDYLVVGEAEHAAHGANALKFAHDPGRFPLVFQNATVKIFRVARTTPPGGATP